MRHDRPRAVQLELVLMSGCDQRDSAALLALEAATSVGLSAVRPLCPRLCAASQKCTSLGDGQEYGNGQLDSCFV